MSCNKASLQKLLDHNQSLASKYQRKSVNANSQGQRATAALKWQRYERKTKSLQSQIAALTK